MGVGVGVGVGGGRGAVITEQTITTEKMTKLFLYISGYKYELPFCLMWFLSDTCVITVRFRGLPGGQSPHRLQGSVEACGFVVGI